MSQGHCVHRKVHVHWPASKPDSPRCRAATARLEVIGMSPLLLANGGQIVCCRCKCECNGICRFAVRIGLAGGVKLRG